MSDKARDNKNVYLGFPLKLKVHFLYLAAPSYHLSRREQGLVYYRHPVLILINFLSFAVVETNLKVSYMLDKHSIRELHLCTIFLICILTWLLRCNSDHIILIRANVLLKWRGCYVASW